MNEIYETIAAFMWIALCIYFFVTMRKANKRLSAIVKKLEDEVSE